MGQTLGRGGGVSGGAVVVVLLMVEGRAKDEDEGRGILALHCTYSMYMEARRDARHESITYKYWMYLRYKQQAFLTASMGLDVVWFASAWA